MPPKKLFAVDKLRRLQVQAYADAIFEEPYYSKTKLASAKMLVDKGGYKIIKKSDENGFPLIEIILKGTPFQGYLTETLRFDCPVKDTRFQRWRGRPENALIHTPSGKFITKEEYEKYKILEPTIPVRL